MIDISKIDGKISDELLAAYIDGNTTEEENIYIQNAIDSDDYLSEVFDIVKSSNMLDSYDWDIHKGDFGFWELGLPPIVKREDLGIENLNDLPESLGADWDALTSLEPNNEEGHPFDSNSSETIPQIVNNDNIE